MSLRYVLNNVTLRLFPSAAAAGEGRPDRTVWFLDRGWLFRQDNLWWDENGALPDDTQYDVSMKLLTGDPTVLSDDDLAVQLEACFSRSTAGSWRVRIHGGDCFVERPKREREAFGVEILGEDYDRRFEDANFIVLAREFVGRLLLDARDNNGHLRVETERTNARAESLKRDAEEAQAGFEWMDQQRWPGINVMRAPDDDPDQRPIYWVSGHNQHTARSAREAIAAARRANAPDPKSV